MTKSKVPLYMQLAEKIIEKIDHQEYVAGDKLPSERELCCLYDMSRITVRGALSELERDGYVKKHHGKGTFVLDVGYQQKLLNLYSFTEEMKQLGKTPTTKVLSFDIISVDKKYAHKLGIESGEKAYCVVRCRLANQEPLIVETSYLPVVKFPKLTKQILVDDPMYDVFSQTYKINATRAEEEFSVTKLNKDEARYLNQKVGEPAMLVKRVTYDEAQEVIEYTISVIHGEKYKYKVELN